MFPNLIFISSEDKAKMMDVINYAFKNPYSMEEAEALHSGMAVDYRKSDKKTIKLQGGVVILYTHYEDEQRNLFRHLAITHNGFSIPLDAAAHIAKAYFGFNGCCKDWLVDINTISTIVAQQI